MRKANADQVQGQGSTTGRATDVPDSYSLRRAQLEVLRKTLGDVTHDVQNHLAIINESAGWMKDLLKLKTKKGFGWIARLLKRNQGQHLNVEPFFKGLNSIQEHVALGSLLTQRLSSFAQRLDKAKAVFDANEALEETIDLLSEQATERDIRLELKLAKEAPMIETDPSPFQLALFGHIEKAMKGLERGGWLVVEAGISEDRFQLHLTSPGPKESPKLASEDPGGRDFSQQIFEDLGGQIWSRSGDGKYVTALVFPLASRAA